MILIEKTLTSIGQYGFCCVSVECSEVTVASSGPGVQAGTLPDRVPSTLSKILQFYLLTKLEKNISKEFSELLLMQQCQVLLLK